MSEVDERRSWTQLRRFEFLEWKMFWEDRVIRNDLETTFDISTPQASVDLRNYREVAPENMEQTARGYRPSVSFRPRYLKASADRLLLQLRAYLSDVIAKSDLWFKEVPPVDIAPDVVRSIKPEFLQNFLRAMRERTAIEISYHALSGPSRRAIAPHALVFDGHRWHARSWCCKNEDFRDFVLSRIDEIGEGFPVKYDPREDLEWQRKIVLKLRPHRGLTSSQAQAIRLDYGMDSGSLNVEMRASIAYYFIRRMNLDLPQSDILTPQRLQIELENLEEVNFQIEAAKMETKALVEARKTAEM
jgi:hypothetical protein